MILHIGNMTVDHAVEIISYAVQQSCFRSTPKSLRLLADEALAAQVEVSLVKWFPDVMVEAGNGEVFVHVRGSQADEKNITGKVMRTAEKIDGVKKVNVYIVPFVVDS